MQFLPTSNTASLQGSGSPSVRTRARDAASWFNDILDRESKGFLDTTNTSEGQSIHADRNRYAPKREEDPGSMQVSREDFAALEEKLAETGMEQEALEELRSQVQSEQGLTWGELVQTIRQEIAASRSGSALTPEQKRNLLTLFQNMGFLPQQAQGLVNKLAEGKFEQVLEKLSQHARQGETFPVSEGNLGELLKVLKLPESAQKRVLSFLQSMKVNGELPKGQLQSLLSMLRQEFSTHADKEIQAAAQLNQEIHNLLKKAQAGSEHSGKADENQVRKGKQLDSANGLAQKASQEHGQKNGQADVSGNGADKDMERGSWAKFLDKVSNESTNFSFTNVHQQASVRTGVQQGAPLTRPPQAAVFDQVQSGILKNLGNGTRQLTLNLTPPDLGKVQVLLQVTDKDVSAVIKAPNQDVSRMVSDQLAQLRTSLEQQGLRVSKLEVQTQLQNQQYGGNWNGPEHHNEQSSNLQKSGWAARWSNRGEPGDEESAGLEGPHNQPEGSGLDLFA